MNRREFVKILLVTPVLIPSTKTIIDLAANTWKQESNNSSFFGEMILMTIQDTIQDIDKLIFSRKFKKLSNIKDKDMIDRFIGVNYER